MFVKFAKERRSQNVVFPFMTTIPRHSHDSLITPTPTVSAEKPPCAEKGNAETMRESRFAEESPREARLKSEKLAKIEKPTGAGRRLQK